MTNKPPLTAAATGSTICPGCNRRFTKTPGAVVETVATVENHGRVDSIGQRHRGIGTHEVTRLWHATCLDGFEAQNAAYRAQVEADRIDVLRAICDASGLDFEQMMAKFGEAS